MELQEIATALVAVASYLLAPVLAQGDPFSPLAAPLENPETSFETHCQPPDCYWPQCANAALQIAIECGHGGFLDEGGDIGDGMGDSLADITAYCSSKEIRMLFHYQITHTGQCKTAEEVKAATGFINQFCFETTVNDFDNGNADIKKLEKRLCGFGKRQLGVQLKWPNWNLFKGKNFTAAIEHTVSVTPAKLAPVSDLKNNTTSVVDGTPSDMENLSVGTKEDVKRSPGDNASNELKSYLKTVTTHITLTTRPTVRKFPLTPSPEFPTTKTTVRKLKLAPVPESTSTTAVHAAANAPVLESTSTTIAHVIPGPSVIDSTSTTTVHVTASPPILESTTTTTVHVPAGPPALESITTTTVHVTAGPPVLESTSTTTVHVTAGSQAGKAIAAGLENSAPAKR